MSARARYRILEARQERRRRLHVLTRVVPGLLNRLLMPVLGWRRGPFVLTMLLQAPRYRKAFARPDDDEGGREVKQAFLLVGVLYTICCANAWER